jgi:PLD-like domain
VTERLIFKHSWSARNDVADVLQGVFIGEVLAPSTTIWLVSPWISDISVIDNTTGAFDALGDPDWGQRHVRLAEVLGHVLANGARVCIATRPDSHNDRFLERLDQKTSASAKTRLAVSRRDELHEKGLLGDHYHVGGSMNFTYGGITVLDEAVRITTDPNAIAQARLEYHSRWGGRLNRDTG